MKTLEDVLNQIDEAYIRACAQHRFAPLVEVLSEKCLVSLVNRPYNSAVGIYPKSAYKTTWECISKDSATSTLVYRKSVHYVSVKLSRNFKMPVGEDYQEVWTLQILGNDLKVLSIVGGG